MLRRALLLLLLALPVRAQVSAWAPTIGAALPGVGAGPASVLSGMDLNADYPQRLIAPLVTWLEANRLTPKSFALKSPDQQAGLLRAAIAQESARANKRAAEIFHETAEGLAGPERWLENADAAEDLLLLSHPFLDAGRRERLVEIHPRLQKVADHIRRQLLSYHIRYQARLLAAEAPSEAGAEAPAVVPEAAREAPAPAAGVYPRLKALVEELADDLLQFVEADPKASAEDQKQWRVKRGELVGWVEKGEGSSDREWLTQVNSHLKEFEQALERYQGDAFDREFSRGKRPEPSEGPEKLKKLGVLRTKACPLFRYSGAQLPEQMGRAELTAWVHTLLLELKPLAHDYMMADTRLSPDAWTTRVSAWTGALEPYVGYPGRPGTEEMSPETARKVLALLTRRVPELKRYLNRDPLLEPDPDAARSLAAEAENLLSSLRLLAKS